ncbi:MAG TPA: ribonuclease P protein component [Micromonosporaceae bacterium]
MLAAAERLRRRSDFAAAVRGGRRASRGVVVIHLSVPTAGAEAEPVRAGSSLPARAGFVVSKAVGNAVTRNKVRRRLRHLVRERLPRLPAGSALVVRALPGAADTSYQRLGADLDAALTAASTPRNRTGRRGERS